MIGEEVDAHGGGRPGARWPGQLTIGLALIAGLWLFGSVRAMPEGNASAGGAPLTERMQWIG